jgi:hypothetical protein
MGCSFAGLILASLAKNLVDKDPIVAEYPIVAEVPIVAKDSIVPKDQWWTQDP